jgi:tetratricopeptide (TPR) repeat protein
VAALVQWSDDRLLEEGERELSRLARSGDLGRIGESYLDSLAGLFADPRRDEVRSPRPRRGFAGLLDRTIVAVAPRDTPLDLRAFDRLARRAGDDGRFAEAAAAQASYRDLLAVLDPWNFAEEEKRVLATLDVLEGLAEAVAGREEEGFARCIAGRDRDPEDPLVLNAFAWYLAVAGFRLAEALPAAEEAARRAPSEPLILDTLGFVLSRLGRYEEAVPWLDEAVDLDRKAAENAPRETPRRRDPGILNRLAVACAKVGRVEEAATLNEEARKMDDTIPPLP